MLTPANSVLLAPSDDVPSLPLVLLPGTLCDHRVFAPMLASLRENVPGLITYVLRTDCYSTVQEAVLQLLWHAPQRFALLGFSLGGILALHLTAHAPERVLGLALLDSTALPVPDAQHATRRARMAQAHQLGLHTYLEQHLWPDYVGAARQDDATLRGQLHLMASSLGIEALRRQTELAINRPDARSLLRSLAMPALVLAGEEDRLCPPEAQRALAAALPNATLAMVPDAGHFALMEKPDTVAAHVAAWFHTHLRGREPAAQDRPFPGDDVSQSPNQSASKDAVASAAANQETTPVPAPTPATGGAANGSSTAEAVLQVERRDFTELVPTDRPRAQSMRGFDPIYTDIVDYIVRCTHRIWDERDVGLIYTHYTHNCVLYGVLGTMYDRESIVRETIQRIAELPDRRGMAISVVWRGNDVDGFYTSHMTHGTGRHTEYGMWGKPTGRSFVTRTIVDCMIVENKIYREWVARDNMAQLLQLGIDPHPYAAAIAQKKFDSGETVVEIAENRRLLGQYPPETEPDLSLAHTETEAEVLRWLHHIYNKRMFGKITDIYSSNCQWHGPLMRELYGSAAVMQQTMRLVATVPDCAFVPQHICSVVSEEGGEKVAIRWVLDGHHLGYGSLGPPTGHKLVVMGFTHLHIKDGKIADEWVLYDELSMLVQIKLGALQKGA